MPPRTPRPFPPTARLAPADDVLVSTFDDELVLLNLRDGVYYGLDGVGARVWKLLQRPVTVAQVRDTILREFEVEPERCDADLAALLSDLVNRGLAVVRRP